MIFLLIAGTYTPFCLLMLSGRLAAVVLATGVVRCGRRDGLNMIWIDAPRWLNALVYAALYAKGHDGNPAESSC
jgi:hemolysin III